MNVQDLTFLVFSTDPRVLAKATLKWEISPDNEEAVRKAVAEAFEMAAEGKAPWHDWKLEAEILASRLGKDWKETPQPTLVEALNRREKLQAFPFQEVVLAPAESKYVNMDPCTPCAGRRLLIKTDFWIGDLCGITVLDLKAGNLSYFHALGAIPGDIFSADAFPFWLSMGYVFPGQRVSMLLRNDTGAKIRVQSVLFGLVKE